MEKTITAITPQVKDAKRCNIYLDGEFFCGMPLEVVVKNRLKVGISVSEERLEELQLECERSQAIDRAMTFLSGAVKTEKQTRDHLKEKGYTPLVINSVIDKLNEYGFLNDGEYAKRYAESYSGKKGARLIKLELMRKGVTEDAAEEAADGIGSQTQTVMQIADKYMRGKEPDLKTLQKLYRHVISKGFSFDDAKEAVDKYKDLSEE